MSRATGADPSPPHRRLRHALTPEDMKNLLLLTFLTPNGWYRPTLPEISAAMQVSQRKARARMLRLAGTP